MKRAVIIIFFSFFSILSLTAQVRVSKLVVKSKEIYRLGPSDILVADTLILMDSAKIILNNLKAENFIRAKVAIFGNGCTINGSGLPGKKGRNGRNGETPYGPCKNGSHGRIGAKGLDGGHGVNLYLYFEQLSIKSNLFVNLTGGNGGNGGDGGHGGGGSPGTIHCNGGNGGNGANGGIGGNGGDGGTLTLSCTRCTKVEDLIDTKIKVMIGGGSLGYGGRGGYEGPPGLGPARRNGIGGRLGVDSANGKSGNIGALKFEKN